ncbi:MAG: translational GTPase TypA [Deferribacteraceae bacterium]|jgi:GTP-binding protein|nr:translational GTPase TypA [Deferribacteraceae bacterium]
MSVRNEKLRNIAIIAHVDHGKTTLVDAMFRQGSILRDNQTLEDRVMDSMDLERERGITIAAKNCAVRWDDVRINIVDTPGHADFGGEVERALSMVDGAILLVDSSEGPLPQTRFVLKKALERGLRIIVVINKIDRKDARPAEVLDEVLDLFIDLDANEEQLEFPILYAIGRNGVAQKNLTDEGTDLKPLFDLVVQEIPAPAVDENAPFSMLVSDLGYSDYLGRLAIGRVQSGKVQVQDNLVRIDEKGDLKNTRITKLQVYDGLALADAEVASAGEIVIMAGLSDVFIGDTITNPTDPIALPRLRVDEPTVAMRFGPNTSPLAGKEGKWVQSARIKERLIKETFRNVAIQVEDSKEGDSFIVKGRGEFQLAILIETMRREGFELSAGRPEVILRMIDGKKMEPIEHVYIDCDEVFLGVVTEKMMMRKGRMINLINKGTGRARVEFDIPSRGLIGYSDDFMTDTKGTGLMNSLFSGYEEYRGDFPTRFNGSLVSDRAGNAVAYGLFHLEPRGRLMVVPGDVVYEGMVVGEYNKDNDLDVNPCKEKKLTNMRASGKDEQTICRPIKPMTLEEAIHFLAPDELVEVTPKSIRIRKVILSAQQRHSNKGKALKAE